jgi:hypothetical protein
MLLLLSPIAMVIAGAPLWFPVVFGVYLAVKRKTPSWQQMSFFAVTEFAALAVSAFLINWLSQLDGI